MNEYDLIRLQERGILFHLDVHFANFMAEIAGDKTPGLLLGAALVSSYTRQGHVCLDLSKLEGKQLLEEEEPIICPKLNKWLDDLRNSPVVGNPGEYKPLIIDKKARLYLYRYWEYQQKLAQSIKRLIEENEDNVNPDKLKSTLERIFPTSQSDDIDWQKVAAFTALTKRFCVISGGPGTGKTLTVAKILTLLSEQVHPKRLRITLAAPTGKAAARLQEVVRKAKERLSCSETIKESIPEEASTIHRLLGSIPGSPYFHHNEENPLPVDVLVVDEASMVDLALMAKLVQALPEEARLILLGDKDQLSSVEAGAVLGDICDTGTIHNFSRKFSKLLEKVTGYRLSTQWQKIPKSMINDCIVQLQKSYRFGVRSGIGVLSQAVKEGDGDRALAILKSGDYPDVKWKDLPKGGNFSSSVKSLVLRGYSDYLKADEPEEVFRLFDCFRILCAIREGPYGVFALNSLTEFILQEQKLITPERRWYRGRPILITRNDYQLQLYNGDVGITLPDPEANNELRLFFPGESGSFRKLHYLRLPEYETVYAMTVHKSQGSEFDRVLFILPDRNNPVLTRELVYTGITRAKESIEIWGSEAVFKAAISARIERSSGLRDALWEE